MSSNQLNQKLENHRKFRKRTKLLFACIGLAASYFLDVIFILAGTYEKWNLAWAIVKAMIIAALLNWRAGIKVEQPPDEQPPQ